MIVFKEVSHPNHLRFQFFSIFNNIQNNMPCILASELSYHVFDNNKDLRYEEQPYINGNIPCRTTYRNTVHCSLHTRVQRQPACFSPQIPICHFITLQFLSCCYANPRCYARRSVLSEKVMSQNGNLKQGT